MITNPSPRCQHDDKRAIAISNKVYLRRCQCGLYWLTEDGKERLASPTESKLAEIVESSIRLTLPGTLP